MLAPRLGLGLLLALASCGDSENMIGRDVDAPALDATNPSPDLSFPDAAVEDAEFLDAEPLETGPVDAGATGEVGELECTNGLDDDDDGYIDCRDFDCDGFATCGQAETSTATCDNGIDDDGDGFADCADFGCAQVGGCGPAERTAALCINQIDDDLDGYTDCDDFSCRTLSVCDPRENRSWTCQDEFDNDGDGYVDCDDFSCRSTSVCRATENDDATCVDGTDNDGDQLVDCLDPDCMNAIACGKASIRIVSWNVQEVLGGDPPSAQGQAALDAVANMLLRMDADLVCLNEVHDDEGFALAALASAAGYDYVFQGSVSTPMAGGLTNACLSRRPFTFAESRSSDDISTDPNANETGRDITEVRVEIVPGLQAVTVFSAHLKSGFAETDYFRRQVEVLRLAQLVEETHAARPNDAVVVMGDFNEERGQEPSFVFVQRPNGLPFSFRLGADLGYPISYDPFGTFMGAGLLSTEPTHEDNNDDATRIPSGRRIDWVLYDQALLVADEVYDPCLDDGVDDDPPGGRMEKAGTPVPCGTAEAASDHWPVMVDLAPIIFLW